MNDYEVVPRCHPGWYSFRCFHLDFEGESDQHVVRDHHHHFGLRSLNRWVKPRLLSGVGAPHKVNLWLVMINSDWATTGVAYASGWDPLARRPDYYVPRARRGFKPGSRGGQSRLLRRSALWIVHRLWYIIWWDILIVAELFIVVEWLKGEMQTAGNFTSYSTIETVQRMMLQILLLAERTCTVWEASAFSTDKHLILNTRPLSFSQEGKVRYWSKHTFLLTV